MLAVLTGCGGTNSHGVALADAQRTETTTPVTAIPPSTTTATSVSTTTTTTNPYVLAREVTSKDGWRYRVTIAAGIPQPDPTDDRCVQLAPPGTTNLRWAISVENLLADRPAPWPGLFTGLNLNEAGTAIDKQATTVLKALSFRPVDISPNEMSMCGLRSALWGGSRSEHLIPPGGTAEFSVTAGPIPEPVPEGTELLMDLSSGVLVLVPARAS